MWKVLAKLQEEIKSLKRPNKERKTNELSKRQKVDLTTDGRAFDRPTSSRSSEPMEIETQLSSAANKQLSSAEVKQLSTAQTSQLSSAQRLRQLSTATIPQDDAVTIQPEDANDPLRMEQEELQREILGQDNDEESSEEEEVADDGIFQDMVGAIAIQGEDESPGSRLLQILADKINLAWKTKINKTAVTALMQKYKVPSNLDALKVPAMNRDIWKLLNKWQRKADLNLSACQRNLIKVVTAVLKLHDNFTSLPRSSRQLAMQTTADIVSLLGKVNRELASKRKISARPALVGDYKSLATSTDMTEENLFGDNLTQDIKDVNIRRKIADPSAYSYRQYSQRRGGNRRGYCYQNYGNYNNYNSSFL